MPERKLKIGAIVKTRLVPAYASIQVGSNIQIPPAPKVGYKSAAGHTEYKDAPEDSPEMQAHIKEVGALLDKIKALKEDFYYDYGVEAWSWDDGQTWQTVAPDGFVFPELFAQYGIKPSINPRVDYIRYKLLVLNEDMATVLDDAIGRARPITNQEVEAAVAGFQYNLEGANTA